MTSRDFSDRGRDRERGDGPVSAALLAPTILMVVFLVIQAGLWGHARNVAIAAAQVGALSARGASAQTSAEAAVRGYLGEVGAGLRGVEVSASQGSRIQVTVQAISPSLVPGVQLPVTGTASAPADRLTSAGT